MLPEIIGRYKITEKLGSGPSTVVYRAFDTEANREVAIKVLAVEQAPEISQRAHFKRELKMIASLEHPAIVPVYDVGEHNGQPYFVMRYMAGGSLSKMIASRGRVPLDETAHIIGRISAALNHAHKQHIIHRDIKPDNILFDLDHNPYISDFGVAKPAATGDSSVTEGQVGTPGYMSPEQANQESVDERSDVYSLGVVIHQMLTGRKKSALDSKTSTLKSKLSTQPIPDILNEVPELPPEVGEIINICLAENKRDRYVTTLDLARALNKAAFGEARTSTFLDRYGNWSAIRSSLLWIVGSLSLLLAFFWMFAGGGNIPFLSVESTPTVNLPPSPMVVPSTETIIVIPPTATLPATFTPEATPTAVTIPGGADQIALVSGNDIYLMNIDGSGLVQVRSENSPKSYLQWIPGNRLVYMSRNCAFLLDAATKQTQQLSCFDSQTELLEGFTVSPSGDLVAISIQRTLNILPFDVETLKNVTTRFNLLENKQNCFYNQFPFREVLWSKDGTRLAAHVIDTRLVNPDQIFLLNTDLKNCFNVGLSRTDTIPGGRIEFDKESTKRIGSFDWDGKSLFLLNDAIRNDGFGNLYLYNSETREVMKLNPINGECCYRDAHWSPDGTYIMFAYQRLDRRSIELYYIPFSDLQSGGAFTPIQLPSGFFATAREKPQPALRPSP
ncbi:MAG TPA: protein kinase [Anaerolineales bacterium]